MGLKLEIRRSFKIGGSSFITGAVGPTHSVVAGQNVGGVLRRKTRSSNSGRVVAQGVGASELQLNDAWSILVLV